jgi:hypothetical protein
MSTYHPEQQPSAAVYVPYLARSSNGQATAGMVLGILAVVIEWGGLLTLALAVGAIIFGAVGLNQSRETGSGHGQAAAGVTLGIIGCALYLIWGVVSLGMLFLI